MRARYGILLALLSPFAPAHELVGEGATVQSLHLLTMPTAGIPPRGAFVVRGGIFPSGTVAAECLAAPLTRFLLGIGFSGSNLIGTGTPQWQPFPGIVVRFRVVEETKTIPAIAVGVHTQGWGSYQREERSFLVPAAGLCVVLSKSYRWWLGELAWHATVGYPLELPSHRRRLNLALGWEHTLGRFGHLCTEYNTLWGDAERATTPGVLSMSLRFGIAPRVALGIQLVDLLGALEATSRARAVVLEWYVQ